VGFNEVQAFCAAGYKGEVRFKSREDARAEIGNFADVLAIDQQVDSAKARSILG